MLIQSGRLWGLVLIRVEVQGQPLVESSDFLSGAQPRCSQNPIQIITPFSEIIALR